MATDDIFESALRGAGDFAGVFEFDGEVAYFYLYDTTLPENQRVVKAIRVFAGTPDFKENDLVICWDRTETKVGLKIGGKLWAAFDAKTMMGFGGSYRAGAAAQIPDEIVELFEA